MSESAKDADTTQRPTDVKSVSNDEFCVGKVKSNLFEGETYFRENDISTEIVVHRDGPDIALSAGTKSDTDGPEMYTYHAITPDQARELGQALIDVADRSEEDVEHMSTDETKQSLLRRLLG